ncbi:MAG: diphosphate--fructose-6-phosphate 1-phosphotransferase [Spirochaetota bacterium]
MNISPLQNARLSYSPKLPASLAGPLEDLACTRLEPALPSEDRELLGALFPRTYGMPAVRLGAGKADPATAKKQRCIGVILSGGPAPGGHNVVAGIFDAMIKANPGSRLFGFRGGPGGLVDDRCMDIDAALIEGYRNTGGFDMIGSGRTKIETPQQFEKALATAKRRGLDAVIVIGGDDSNTNAAVLAEYFAARGEPISVIGVPKTIDGDLKSDVIETSFGFDTATKLYSELAGNIARDAASGRKYWHFVKLMGRSASHITLECALQVRPNVALISEEIEAKKLGLSTIVGSIADSVAGRAAKGENFGIVLVPEGLLEFIPEMKVLIDELNEILAADEEAFKALSHDAERIAFVGERLSHESATLFDHLPEDIRAQLLWDRDPHGNVQFSRIETEKLLAEMVGRRLALYAKQGDYVGKWDFQTHFLGYEGRCAFPSNFDADYCYALGYTAASLVAAGLTGYLSSVRNLTAKASEWIAGGVPLVALMNIERRHGQDKAVIRKALVDLKGVPFAVFAKARDTWAFSSDYRVPGGIQYFGPPEVADLATETLRLEHEGR